MNKRKKILILVIGLLVIGITTVYASTIINSKDVIYDNSKSNGNSDNVQGALDELYDLKGTSSSSTSSNRVKIINENMISYITSLAKTDTTDLAYDDTSDKNLRYVGSNPNNYVYFNDELWRIIGVMNNVKDANGASASRVKIIRAEPIVKTFFDNSYNSQFAPSTVGNNDWPASYLKKLLNEDYYNKKNNYSDIGLNTEVKTMITNVTWNLGGYSTYNVTASTMYVKERGKEVYGSRPTSSTGYVGLMHPSDFGYAVGGENRTTCLSTPMVSYKDGCNKFDYLYYDKGTLWTMTPYSGNSTVNYSIAIGGFLNWTNSQDDLFVSPVVYLNTSLLITKGEGTKSSPYRISYEKEKGTNDASNASPPNLDDEGKLLPVTLDDDGIVTYVSKDDLNWYNYEEKHWANAIILVDSPSKTYKEGDVISESDIESYFVWIPKYKYRLWNTGTASKNAHEIDIVFDTTDTVDKEGVSCKTPMTSGSSGNCDNGEYMTHPAFISLGVDGFWVGKFETGYKGATSTSAAEVSSSDSSKIIIKPSVYSWRNNTVYNFFVSAYNYERSLDSHMMKNTEWGAVAYLSHSKYGLGYEVNINNNSSFKTGYSALPSTEQSHNPGTYGDGSSYNNAYNTSVGYLASTTGNITGIYDMSGGSLEYLASYKSGYLGASGFTVSTIANYNTKYFDVYNESSTQTSYQYRILGDATGEMGPIQNYKDGDDGIRYHNSWYNDFSYFVDSSNPWFDRGGFYDYGVLAGQFNFNMNSGDIKNPIGSRIVLSP